MYVVTFSLGLSFSKVAAWVKIAQRLTCVYVTVRPWGKIAFPPLTADCWADVSHCRKSRLSSSFFPLCLSSLHFPEFQKKNPYKQHKGTTMPLFFQHVSKFLSIINQLLTITLVKNGIPVIFRKMAIFQSSFFVGMWLSVPGSEATVSRKETELACLKITGLS